MRMTRVRFLILNVYRIQTYPTVEFIVVINPNSGPDGRPDLPDAQYQRAVPYLQGYQNVAPVRYVKTLYIKQTFQSSKEDVDKYSRWHELSKNSSMGRMGLDGIFVDEVDCD